MRINVRIIPTKTEVKKDDRNTVTEWDDSHRKTIVLLKRNVNFLLTGTVNGTAKGEGGGGGALMDCSCRCDYSNQNCPKGCSQQLRTTVNGQVTVQNREAMHAYICQVQELMVENGMVSSQTTQNSW